MSPSVAPRFDELRRTSPTITLGGSQLDAQLLSDLLDLRIVRGTRSTGRATLTFVDRTFDLARSKFKLGQPLKVSSIEPASTLFEGTVTGLATESGEGGARVTVTAHDKSYDLARSSGVATFMSQTPEDAIQSIATAAGMRAKAPSSGLQQSWFWRADSILGQVDEICERLGWEWMVEGDTLHCIDVSDLSTPSAACKLTVGEELTRFAAEESGPVATEVTVRGWDEKTKRVVEARKRTPKSGSGFLAGRQSTADATTLVTRLGASSQDEAAKLAAAIAGAGATVTARGRGIFAPLVQPGRGVEIAGAGPSDGVYYVREVEHAFDGGLLRTSFVAGFRPPVRITDPWQTRRSASSLATGLHIALVDDNRGNDDFPGRIRVTIPTVSAQDSMQWARLATPGGGSKRGMQWVPEVNDEVVIAFEDGDVRRPVIIGGLFNGKDLPPLEAPVKDGKVVKRTLTSRLGHKLEMGDGSGEKEEYIDLELAGGKVKLHLGKDRVDLETEGKPLRIASGQDEIVFDGNGTITIKAKTIKLDAQQDVEISGTNVKAKGQSAANLEATTVTVKANASLKLQASGMAELAGSVVKIN